MRLAFSPYSNWLGIAHLPGLAATTFYVDGLQYAVPRSRNFLSRSRDFMEALAPNPATQNKARFQLNLVVLGANPADERGRC